MTNRKAAALLLVLAAVFSPFQNTAPAKATQLALLPASYTEYWKQDLLGKVNQLRLKGCRCGRQTLPPAKPLRWSATLETMALTHAGDMASNRFMGHYSSTGKGISDRAKRAGYQYTAVGENVAVGYESTESVFQGWKASPGHCRNMMRTGFTEMGAARQGDYWAQEFGDPRN